MADLRSSPLRVAIIGGGKIQISSMLCTFKLSGLIYSALRLTGIAGLSLALGIIKQKAEQPLCNVDLQIYEQAPQFAEIGAGVAFGPNGR